MREVYEFLELDLNPPELTIIEQSVNPTAVEIGKFERSPQIYEAQKRISEPLMAEMKTRLGGYPAAWYDRHYASAPIHLG